MADSLAQEGWLAEHARDGGNGLPAGQQKAMEDVVPDPMQGLEGLDVAGPQQA